jgi:hypothetical protein
MKLCLIGNSHVAMLAAAANTFEFSGLTCLPIAKPSLELSDFSLDGTVLSGVSAPLRTRLAEAGLPGNVDLESCDAVVLVACTVSVFTAVRFTQTHRIDGWPSTETPEARPLLSRAAFVASLAEIARKSVAGQLANQLSTCTKPVFFIPQPYPSRRILRQKQRYPLFARIAEHGQGVSLAHDLFRAQQEAYGDQPHLQLLRQDDRTVAQDFLTAAEYTRGSVRLTLSAQQPADDVIHANHHLGALYLRKILQVLEKS